MSERKGPVLIELDEEAVQPPEPSGPVKEFRTGAAPNPADAPPVPDSDGQGPYPRAMQTIATLGARRPSRLTGWFWSLLALLMGATLSITAWDFVASMLQRNPVLGWGMSGLFVIFVLVCAGIALREIAGFARLAKVDALHRAAAAALAEDDLDGAREVVEQVMHFYANRADTEWGRARLSERIPEELDAYSLLTLADAELLAPLDRMAELEVQAAARQVATVTALVPLAFADVVAAALLNFRMIRRLAEIYGGRSGGLSTWRLLRAVLTHLVATGAVAVGDDMLEPIIGGGLLDKLSRRFGEGLVNGALTVRVGIAAMDVCRPLPFSPNARPSVRRLIKSALTGFVSGQRSQAD